MSIKLMQKAWETELKGNELLVLLSLSDNASDEGYCWPSWASIIKKTKVSKGTLASVLKKLEDRNFIKRESRKRQNGSDASNGYYVLQNTQSSEVEHHSKVQKLNTQSSEVEHPYEPSKEPSNINIYAEFKKSYDFIDEDSFLNLLMHLKSKYEKVTKKRLNDNIKKLKTNPSLFKQAVDKMIELDYSGLFVPSIKEQKQLLSFSEQKELNQSIKVEVYPSGHYKDANGDIRDSAGYIA